MGRAFGLNTKDFWPLRDTSTTLTITRWSKISFAHILGKAARTLGGKTEKKTMICLQKAVNTGPLVAKFEKNIMICLQKIKQWPKTLAAMEKVQRNHPNCIPINLLQW